MPPLRRSPQSLLLVGLVGVVGVACVTGCGGSDATPAHPASPLPPPGPPAVPAAASPGARFDYPPTRREAVSETLFGTRVDDPYRWLEDGSSPEVQRWMTAQSDFARAKLAALPGRDAFARRLAELSYNPTHGIPRARGSRLFYLRKNAHAEKEALYWTDSARDGTPGPEKLLLDPNTWSQDGSVSLHEWSVSWDGGHVAYSVHANNADEGEMHVLDVDSGTTSDTDVIPHTKFSAPSWTAKGDAFVYTYVPVEDGGKPIPAARRTAFAEVRRHVLGTPADKDEVVYPKSGDETKLPDASYSEDGHWLIVELVTGANREDIYFRDLRTAASAHAPFVPLVTGRDAEFRVDAYRDHFYIQTNDGAAHGKLVVADPAHPQPDRWKTLIAERDDEILTDTGIVGGKLSITYRKDVASRLELHRLDGTLDTEIPLPGLGTTAALSGRQDATVGYYWYASYTFPQEIFRYDLKLKKASSYYRQKLPLTPEDYVAEEGFAPSKDGTKVPVFVVHRKDVQKSSGHPVRTILYGYGGFAVAQTPEFWGSIIPWLDSGGVFAFASLRGGSEYGEDWHRQGRRHDKQHVFDDAIGSAEWLIREGWTDPAHLAVRGASNGGLLVGALVTERPDLFAVGLCGVPLLDMLRFDRFGMGRFWVDEYGSPTRAEDFAALYAYSPYHHVTARTRYPALLMLSADSDDRVDPLHARKFAAAVQAGSSGGPVLLRIERSSGHGGADTVRSRVAERADEYAFALANMPANP